MTVNPEVSWAEYIKAGTEAISLIKTLYPLLPTQNREQVEAKIEAAERALKLADAKIWKDFGFKLHDCQYPPPMMFREKSSNEHVCSACGYKTKSYRPPDDDGHPFAQYF